MSEDTRERFTQRTALWRWTGGANNGAWFFVRLTGEVAEAISALVLMRRLETCRRAGWNSHRVEARIGATTWSTSIFPGGNDTWLLPVKKSVRAAEELVEDSACEVEIAL